MTGKVAEHYFEGEYDKVVSNPVVNLVTDSPNGRTIYYYDATEYH